ncbi:hypothetical protein Bpfe_013592, partial [Biomphalaria pfeifferi]
MVAQGYTPSGLFFSLTLFHLSLSPVVTSGDGRTSTPKRYGTYLDALPPHGSGEHQEFISRVIQWHSSYCGKDRLCLNQAPTLCYRCAPCACDHHCFTHHDCCPDRALEPRDEDLTRPFTGFDMNVLSCESARFHIPEWGERKSKVAKIPGDSTRILVGHYAQNSLESYYMVSRCPHSFTQDRDKCERGDIAPVTSLESSSEVVFKNVHCARCHGVLDSIPWDIKFTCEKAKKLTSFQTAIDLAMMFNLANDCESVFIPPPQNQARKCYVSKVMITKCNVTGKWRRRDSFYERACNSYVTPKLIDGLLYKNVFCYKCNYDESPSNEHKLLSSCQINPLTGNTSMDFTLRQSDVNSSPSRSPFPVDQTYKMCGKFGVYDNSEEVCREIVCEQGQHPVSGFCLPIFLTATGLGFELYFGLRPLQIIDLAGKDDLRHYLPAEMEVYLSQTLLQNGFQIQYFAMSFNTTDSEGRCGQLSTDLGVYTRVVSKSSIDQKKVQEELLRLRFANFTLSHGTWNLTYQAFPSETPRFIMHPDRHLLPLTSSACVIVVSNDLLRQKKEGILRVGTTTPDPSRSLDSMSSANIIRISSLLECPHVRLFPHEYTVPGPGGSIGLHWGDTDSVVYRSRYTMDLDGNVSICLEDFLLKLNRDTSKRSGAENIVVAVLLPISLFSLLACFTVFVAFAELRSLSGKNNMLLTASLFCSQGALLLGYVVEDLSVSCVAIGILTHYFCLCLLCALIVCSYNVYATFATMHLSVNLNREWRSLLLYCCFIFILPIPVVVVVIITHLVTHLPAVVVGYGGGAICIVSKATAIWVSLFVPIGVCLVITSILFVLTCTSLRHNKDVETNALEERHVQFYFRASLMTSLSWIVGFVGILTSFPSIRIAFIVLQCILGIYVFVTLVLTERVTRLLTGCCCGSRRPPRGRTSLNLKMASRSDCPARNPCIVATGFRKTGSDVADGVMADNISQRTSEGNIVDLLPTNKLLSDI